MSKKQIQIELLNQIKELVFRKEKEQNPIVCNSNLAIQTLNEIIEQISNTEAIIEEMADCYIMLEQMQMIFGLDSTVIADAMNKKVERLEKRLGCEGLGV